MQHITITQTNLFLPIVRAIIIVWFWQAAGQVNFWTTPKRCSGFALRPTTSSQPENQTSSWGEKEKYYMNTKKKGMKKMYPLIPGIIGAIIILVMSFLGEFEPWLYGSIGFFFGILLPGLVIQAQSKKGDDK
jgi:hypothetical protein